MATEQVERLELRELQQGLDALEAPRPVSELPLVRFVRALAPRLAVIVLLVLVWQLVVILHVKPTYALPAPGDVWAKLVQQAQAGHLQEAILTSLRRAALGYAAALMVGTLVGLAVSRLGMLRTGVGSLLAALLSLPSVTWVPIGILWFGLSDATIYFVVILGAFPSIARGVISAVDQIDPVILRLARSLDARGPSLYRHFMLPAAMPGYLSGMQQAWAFSWRSLMAAELIAISPQLGLGLGQLLDSGRELADMPLALAAMIGILAVGLAVDELLFRPLERTVLRRRGLAS
ncbi:MAG: ABC transporter permease subunit [Candidatus Dormibacteraeota bacterium]|nr:ABC transporter permease subunit [Candidatus Dormibacteraeota bacterium]